MERRPAGIVEVGKDQNGWNYITYPRPLEWLLADIKSCGFQVPLDSLASLLNGTFIIHMHRYTLVK